ncbi:probable pectinesterase/pectinesterase inhibitor 17 [Phoenix dactylifera]|uniref:Pectinesterase n=1 Tax=Phoenix dactylifera TaxID=42345 RepID=A0A8B8ZPC3_PHODC|nr:probable pectinesterase/pectinesterase inhibitor 17 [Phoenix dactylifera]
MVEQVDNVKRAGEAIAEGSRAPPARREASNGHLKLGGWVPQSASEAEIEKLHCLFSVVLDLLKEPIEASRQEWADRAVVVWNCSGTQVTPNAIVSKKGDGNYMSLTEAVSSIPDNVQGRHVIYVKAGVYDENVVISKPNITLVGDGIVILADNFIGRCITFENTSGAEKEQAVALRSDWDNSVFHHCEFLGYQDTLYVNGGRQFFRECNIYGSVDFIFGDARMVLQKCNIRFRKPRGENVTTAQGREQETENTGIILHCCNISDASDFKMGAKKGYLGSPWKTYSKIQLNIVSTTTLVLEPHLRVQMGRIGF